MHLKRAEITNLRALRRVVWELEDTDRLAGWHVILGDNGAGKSSFLRAIAAALNGPMEVAALRLDPSTWLNQGAKTGKISIAVVDHPNWDIYSGRGKRFKSHPQATIKLERDTKKPERVFFRALDDGNPSRTVWGSGSGWFSASYGPFRRFSGGDKEMEKLYYSNPKVARHLTLFGENVALSECALWLKDLRFRALENQNRGQQNGGEEQVLIDKLMSFVNDSEFLPRGTRLSEVTPDGVFFTDANGASVVVEELSDGYRSVLSMTFEVIRQLAMMADHPSQIFDEEGRIVVPGVMIVDEIDVHLHPQWQRRVGSWLTSKFPNFQFIVSTHSPLICQSAENGSIFRLPAPGTGERAQFMEGVERDRMIYGNVLDAYGTEAFGHVATRSEAGREMLEELARLNMLARRGRLDAEAEKRRRELERTLPTARSRASS